MDVRICTVISCYLPILHDFTDNVLLRQEFKMVQILSLVFFCFKCVTSFAGIDTFLNIAVCLLFYYHKL